MIGLLNLCTVYNDPQEKCFRLVGARIQQIMQEGNMCPCRGRGTFQDAKLCR